MTGVHAASIAVFLNTLIIYLQVYRHYGQNKKYRYHVMPITWSAVCKVLVYVSCFFFILMVPVFMYSIWIFIFMFSFFMFDFQNFICMVSDLSISWNMRVGWKIKIELLFREYLGKSYVIIIITLDWVMNTACPLLRKGKTTRNMNLNWKVSNPLICS